MNREIIIDKNMLELTPQGDFSFPFNLMHIELSKYPFGTFPCHWHPGIEMTYILDGEMTYLVNQKSFLLKKGDCVFVNANVLHSGEQYKSEDCNYICFVFQPSMVSGFSHSVMENRYVNPILENKNFDYALISADSPEHLKCEQIIERITHLDALRKDGYHIYIQSQLTELWALIYHAYKDFLENVDSSLNPAENKQIQRLKKALTFIYDNYTEPITLDEIAASCHTSKSEFCRLFKKALHRTPFDFLLHYRVEKSLPLLCNNNLSITEVASQVGFSGSSYYAEVFRKFMNCSPSQYRKQHMNDED